ncbi:MAG: hypothetical protein GC185_07475 [Alphaproteobacteria bacterium]|nr:hypothetical protein [Alphaproteobacteria bacterium]
MAKKPRPATVFNAASAGNNPAGGNPRFKYPRPVPVSPHDLHNFFHAVKNNHLHDIRKFVEKHPDAVHLRQNGQTALQTAVERGHIMAVDALLELGADPNAQTNSRKDSVLMAAVKNDRTDLLGRLLHKGGFSWQKLNDGTTLMMRAAKHDSEKTIAMLHGRGSIATARDKQGRDAMIIAAENDAGKAIKALCDGGEDVNSKNAQGDTALIVAVKAQNENAARALLENRADYKMTNAQGKTAAEIARENWFEHGPFLRRFEELLDERMKRDAAAYEDPFHKGTPENIEVRKPFTVRPRKNGPGRHPGGA